MFNDRYVTSENGNTFYCINKHERSDAKTIIFLHGLGVDYKTFEKQLEYFSKEYTVIAWDAPFHKRSRPYKSFTISNCVDELSRIIEVEKVGRFILVGQSMGGVVSQNFIDRYRGRVDAFIGIGSPPVGSKYLTKFDGKLLKLSIWFLKFLPLGLIAKLSSKSNSLSDYGRSYMKELTTFYSKKEFLELTEVGFRQLVDENRDVVIDCPSLAIYGDKEITGYVKFFKKVWGEITKRPVVIISNAAHISNMDNPKEVNNAIEEFIKSL